KPETIKKKEVTSTRKPKATTAKEKKKEEATPATVAEKANRSRPGEKRVHSQRPIMQPKPRSPDGPRSKTVARVSQPVPRSRPPEVIPKAIPIRPPASTTRKAPAQGTARGNSKTRPGTTATTVSPAVLARYQRHIHDVFMGRWRQPAGITHSRQAKIHIRIRRDGTITDVRLVSSSRNSKLDASALAAARSVRKVNPLPRGLNQQYYEPIINFELN
ncbi:MAG: TonB family protein, partial [Verrucomicrobiota bacterium]